MFKQNWNNPGFGGGEKQPGCWYDFQIADVHFIMLDGRYYRDKKGGSIRVEGIEGIQQLRFGFIGRRQPRGEAVRRWREGQRVMVVEGLGGLGKTALCAELLRLLAGECRVLALDGRWAGAQPQPLTALWQEVQAARDDEAWSAELAGLQRDGLTGASLARAV
ncbi:MAG: hypothetical protein GY824_14870, partial [Delftia sp.]|nr:hypothetical protein [Delftia sp.]